MAPEPLLSANKARAHLAKLKGGERINHDYLYYLVKNCGLPVHDDPFGSGNWCFVASEIDDWYQRRMAQGSPLVRRGPGRPRKSNQVAKKARREP